MATCTTCISPPIPAAPTTKVVTRPATKLPPSLVNSAVLKQRIDFDPDKHVCYHGMPEIITMADIGKGMYGISPVAVSAPFPLFTDEAVHQMRAEAFTPEVLDNCQVSSSFATHMIRAYGPKYATFAWQAWHNAKVQAIVSEVAGIDLVPTLPCDVGHINVSVGLPAKPNADGEDTSAFGWHVDSTPFVVVTMLSDCTGMVGGETAIRTGSGEIVKVRGPTMGTAVVMQGRYIEHQALKAFGGRERLAMVTSWRPRSVHVRDETVLAGVRGITDQNELYYSFSDYRFRNIELRFRAAYRKLRADKEAGLDYDIDAARAFLEEQRDTIALLLQEIRHE